MQFTSIVTSLLTAAFAAAQSAATNTSQEFHLKTELLAGNPAFNDLYPVQYHTSAGTYDIVLQSSAEGSLRSWFNGTRAVVDFGADSNVPWAWSPDYSTYDMWNTAVIATGEGAEGFVIDQARGFVWAGVGSESWVVCEWVHGEAQLFWAGTAPLALPSCSCAQVRLLPELI